MDGAHGGSGGGGGDFSRSDALMEGTRMLIDNLREKTSDLEERCGQLDREKKAVGELLISKKRDYEEMKDHYLNTIDNLEEEVQRLKSEKSRLLDKLQLPESERNSLAAEEAEIAELKRKLEDAEIRLSDQMSESDDLRQEIRDLQLEMEEVHDRFRDDERAELRELQRELEGTAKNCRIVNFKLRKAERKVDQLESERTVMEEKLRNFESCFQSSDDKRRIRVLEEDLRTAKEVSVRLHDELERVEERRARYEEDLDESRAALSESESQRLTLKKEIDRLTSEYGSAKTSGPDLTRLSRDLRESVEREAQLRDRLQATERDVRTLRRSLSESESSKDNLNAQLRRSSIGAETTLMSLSSIGGDEQDTSDVKALRKRMEELQQDNENLLCAVKYLRSKMEQKDSSRCATPVVETKATKDMLARLSAQDAAAAASGTNSAAAETVRRLEKELKQLKDNFEDLELENLRLTSDNQRLRTSTTLLNTRKNNDDDDNDDGDVITESKATLMSRVRQLETDKATLKAELGALKDRTTRLLSEVADLRTGTSSSSSISFSHKLPTTLYGLEEECRRLKISVVEMEVENAQLADEMKAVREQAGGGTEADRLRERIAELETENKDLTATVEQLTAELEASRVDMDKMIETRQEKEQSLTKDVEMLRRKNGELSDMLESTIEKSEAVEKQLDQSVTLQKELEAKMKELDATLTTEKSRLIETRQNETTLQQMNEQLNEEIAKVQTDNERLRKEFVETKNELTKRFDELQKEYDVITKQLNESREELNTVQADLAACRADLDSAKENLTTSKEDYKTKKKELKLVKDDLRSTKEELNTANEALKQSKDDYKTTKDDLKANKKDLKATKEELRVTKEELKTTKEELKTTSEECATAQLELSTARAELDVLREENSRTKGAIKSNQDVLKSHTDELTNVRDELRKLKEDYKKIKDDNKKKSNELQKAAELLQASNNEIEQVQASRTKTIDDLNELKEQLKQSKSSHQSAREELKKVEVDAEAAKEELSKVKEEQQEGKNDLRKVKEEARRAKDDLSRAQNDLQKTKDEYQKTKDELRQTKDELRSVKDDVKILKEDLQTTTNGCRKAKEELQPTKDALKRAMDELKRAEEEGESAKDGQTRIKEDLQAARDEVKKVKEEGARSVKEFKSQLDAQRKQYDELKRDTEKATKDLLRSQDDLKIAKEFKSKFESLQKSFDSLKRDNEKLTKEKEKWKPPASTPVTALKDREPGSWKQEKLDLEKQLKDIKQKYDAALNDIKKVQTKTDSDNKGKSNNTTIELEKTIKELTQAKDAIEKRNSELNTEVQKLTQEVKSTRGAGVQSKNVQSKELDDLKEQQRQLMQERDSAIKQKEESMRESADKIRELELIRKEKEALMSERKSLLEKHEALVRQRDDEETGKEKERARAEASSKEKDSSSPLILTQARQQLKEKETELVEKDKLIKKLTETSELKENELKVLRADKERADFQIKNLNDRIAAQLSKLESLGVEHRKIIAESNSKRQLTENELERANKENRTVGAELKDVRERFARHEESCTKEKGRLEAELRQAQETLKKSTSAVRTITVAQNPSEGGSSIDSSSTSEEVNRLNRELAEVNRLRNIEKYDLQKVIADKTKLIEDNKVYIDRLKTEVDKLRSQVADHQKSGPSRIINIPIHQDRTGTTTIPVQQLTGGGTTSSDEMESTQSHTPSPPSISVHTGESGRSTTSAESLAFEAERQQLIQRIRMAEEYRTRYTAVDRSLEETKSKLQAEESKRRDLENRLKVQENAWKLEKAAMEEKLKMGPDDDKSGNPTAKMSDIRNRFEKFGSTAPTASAVNKPSAFRKGSLTTPAPAVGAANGGAVESATGSLVDKAMSEAREIAKDLQKQLADVERARHADRQELMEKIDRLRREYEHELQAYKLLSDNRQSPDQPSTSHLAAQLQFRSTSPLTSLSSQSISSNDNAHSRTLTPIPAPGTGGGDRLRSTLVVPIRKAGDPVPVDQTDPTREASGHPADDRQMAGRRIGTSVNGVGMASINEPGKISTGATVVRVTASPRTQIQINRVDRPGSTFKS